MIEKCILCKKKILSKENFKKYYGRVYHYFPCYLKIKLAKENKQNARQ